MSKRGDIPPRLISAIPWFGPDGTPNTRCIQFPVQSSTTIGQVHQVPHALEITPPCMQVSSDVFAQPPPAVLPPPTVRASPGSERRYFGDVASRSMSQASSSNSLGSFTGAPGSVPGPSFATNVVVSNKGSKYEISGPVNFQHVSGDVTRDRTRNAFDLNAGANDNVLKKYMMERGIAEEDVAGIRRQDLIKKIVHSNFTWMPTKQDLQKPRTTAPKLVYATISTNNEITPPPSPPPAPAAAPSTAFSNYASLTSRFVDISDMEMAPVERPNRQQELGTVVPVQLHLAQPSRPKIPPPPSAVTAANTHMYPAALEVPTTRTKPQNETYATIAPQTQRKVGTMRVAPPAPPKPTIVPSENRTTVQYAPVKQPPPPPVKPAPVQPRVVPVQVPPKPKTTTPVSNNASIPPPPPAPPAAPVLAGASGAPPPPPPPPALATGAPMPPPPPPMSGGTLPLAIKKSEQPKVAAGAVDDRDAFLESIRKGVQLKKIDKKAATISGIKPRAEKKPPTTDFLSELKLGITLRRVKNPADNPYSEANANSEESHA